MENMNSEFSHHTGCDECGSSDARAVYKNGSSYCFACCSWFPPKDSDGGITQTKQTISKNLLKFDVTTLNTRRIPDSICNQYKYGVSELGGKVCQVANYYDKDRKLVAQKVRFKDKTFRFLGEPNKATLFGQQLWSTGGKKLTITEGEIDALSVATAFEGKYPVVSIAKGAKSAKKEIARHLEWITSFDEIYLWFDNDEPGRQAVEECVAILPIDKVRIVRHPDYKDANELLVSKGKPSVVNAFYNAEKYKPEGVLLPSDIKEEAMKPVEYGRPWFMDKLTRISYGRRLGEVVSLGAGVSVKLAA
jgi:twinkle protein